jgi:uncharacterized membrane protein
MSFVYLEEPDALQLSSELRHTSTPAMKHRRFVIGLSLVATASLAVVAAYQIGILKHVPEPDLPLLDADKVDSSAEAFQKLSTPDAFVGMASYGVTMVLAAMGGPRRARQHPFVPLALAAKVAFDVANAGKLAVDQWTKHKAFCSWCMLAAAATFATAPFVVPEAKEALDAVRRHR